ncbi:MAG: uncharacterized protein QOF48_1392 [Verrucomicrobiota bacterium]|jgi:uncharacterized protein Yka (UPF0111/DUF47 family)
MFSLQKLLGKDDKFFKLMEGSAEEARAGIRCLVKLVKHPDKKDGLQAFAEVRRKDKRITQELTEHLCKTFVTPLEREDIEALSAALYRIPKTAEKFGERLLLAPQHVKGWDVAKQMDMLEQAADTVVLLVEELRAGVNIEKVRAQNELLQKIEGEADKLMVTSLDELYNGDHSALRVVILKDLYELLEKVFDRCRDVGNVVFQIVLKHS